MFGKKSRVTKKEYDKAHEKPVLHCSICTGEQVAGFKNLETGKFREVMLIRSDRDLKAFKETYGVVEIYKEY